MTINIAKQLDERLQNRREAFCASCKAANITIVDDPLFAEAQKQVFAFSDFVARSCIRNPEVLNGLVNSGDLQRSYEKGEFRNKLSKVLWEAEALPEEDDAKLGNILAGFRLREMLRIAWRDLAGWADLLETMADLSTLADTCITHAFSVLYKWQCSKFGVPTGKDGTTQNLVVLGMGKLGAGELNFSSDVDLIFAYPQAGETKGGPSSITNDEFFVRLCRRFLRLFGNTSPDGILFRVDMRLRPYGENGPIVMSFDAMETYYQIHGREWERYALIKARVVARDPRIGARLLENLNPFVYRRYLDFGVFESLREMKHKIEHEVKRKGLKENIKLGAGGIREIEFFGQIFQLIRGGVLTMLKERGILKVLVILVQEGYIPQNVCDELTQAYVFLRNTENRLQEFADQQTHSLPTDTLGKLRLAASMGFEDWESFFIDLEGHMRKVHLHFHQLLLVDDAASTEDNIENRLVDVWLNLIEDEEGEKVLSDAGFEKPADVLRLLNLLRDDFETRVLSRNGRNRLDKLIPPLLKKIGSSGNPHLTLNRIVDLLKTLERRTCYISLLLENPTALTHLVKLSNASPWIISFLTRHPVLLDELLDTRTLYAPLKKNDLEKELRRRLNRLSAQDLEYQMDEVRIFKQANTLRIAAADVSGAFPLMKVSDYLTDIAETVINEILQLSWNYLVKKHGTPACLTESGVCDKGFAVIAYGKLGGIELGYGSDLDLVFLHAGAEGQTKGADRPINNSDFFNRLGQRIIHFLTIHTPAGILYETDMRLRPSGISGVLVSHVEAFEEYYSEKAWTWEHQALVKARAICGDIHIARRFEEIRKKILTLPRSGLKLQEEIISMRERMRKERSLSKPGIFDLKQDRGGIVDIEFFVQYLVLLHAHENNELVKWTDNIRLLETLAEAGIIGSDTAQFLKDAYLTYRSETHKLSLQKKPACVPEDKFRNLREEVNKIWGTFYGNKPEK